MTSTLPPADPSGAEGNPPSKRMAVVSLVLGIVGLPTFGLLGIGAVTGIVLGMSAFIRAGLTPAKSGGKGLALGGITANVVALGLFVYYVLIPDLVPSTITFNENTAIGDVATIRSAQKHYADANGGYFDRLECLSNPCDCIPGYPKDGQVFIGIELTDATTRYGYRRVFHPGPAADLSENERSHCSPTSLVSFAYVATPEEPGKSGARAFCADSTGRICEFPDGEVPSIRDGLCPSDCMALQ